MKILMLSTDSQILAQESSVHSRMMEYAGLFDELHIIVFTRQGEVSISRGNLFIYPVGALFNPMRLFHGWRVGRMLCRRMRLDVISVQSPDEIGIIGFLLSRSFRIPLQLQIHTDIYSPWYRRASWKERIRYWIARFLVPRVDCIRVVSQRIADSLFQTKSGMHSRLSLEQKISILPIFTDVAPFLSALLDAKTQERFKEYSFKMIAVGRFVEREKHFSMLIQMMREFVKMCPRALLVIVGAGPEGERYKLQAISYKLENNIIIEPWRDNLATFYKCFDVFLSPSNYEGWGRAVIEAMAAGLAVVMTDVGLAGEVVQDGQSGRIVSVGDGEAFLDAVANLYKNAEKRKAIAVAGQKAVRALASKTKEEYLALYKMSFISCIAR